MSAVTKIQWCDSTWNAWIGCTKVMRECDECYAAHSTPARTLHVTWGPGQPRHRTSTNNWEELKRLDRAHDAFHAQHGRRRRVFMGSLMDPFDNEVPDAWRNDYWEHCAMTPNLDKLVLTKRIGNARRMLPPTWLEPGGWPRDVWLGITAGTQDVLDRDAPKLLELPARVRFISFEPLLEEVNASPWFLPEYPHCPTGFKQGAGMSPGYCGTCAGHVTDRIHTDPYPRIHWAIVGGESGPRARPMHMRWARELLSQAVEAGVAPFMKQLGAKPQGWCAALLHMDAADRADIDESEHCDLYEAHEQSGACDSCACIAHPKGGDPEEWPEDMRIREFPRTPFTTELTHPPAAP